MPIPRLPSHMATPQTTTQSSHTTIKTRLLEQGSGNFRSKPIKVFGIIQGGAVAALRHLRIPAFAINNRRMQHRANPVLHLWLFQPSTGKTTPKRAQHRNRASMVSTQATIRHFMLFDQINSTSMKQRLRQATKLQPTVTYSRKDFPDARRQTTQLIATPTITFQRHDAFHSRLYVVPRPQEQPNWAS